METIILFYSLKEIVEKHGDGLKICSNYMYCKGGHLQAYDFDLLGKEELVPDYKLRSIPQWAIKQNKGF